MVVLDEYLWNEHTDLLRAVMPAELEPYDDTIYGWYEIKQGRELFREKGAVVLESGHYAWLGLPRSQGIVEYLTMLLE